MIIEIEVPDDAPTALQWYLVKHILHGAALGCRPYFAGPNALPPLKQTGVKFAPDPSHGSGRERFRLPLETLARGVGDCDALALYEVARRQAQHGHSTITIADLNGDGNMHAQIRRPDGSIEDPSIEHGAMTDWPKDFLYDLKR